MAAGARASSSQLELLNVTTVTAFILLAVAWFASQLLRSVTFLTLLVTFIVILQCFELEIHRNGMFL